MNNNVCCSIVTYNCDNDFINTFNSVVNQVDKVIIIDNGSEDETIEILKDLQKRFNIELVLCKKNIGIASALNIGIDYAKKNKYDWILTLDHDSILDKCMVENLLKAYNELSEIEKEKVVSLLPRYIEAGLNIEEQLEVKKDEIAYVKCGITSGNLVKMEIFEKVGEFDDKLFIDFVDFDLCFRIIEKGYAIIEVSNAILYHTVGNVKEAKILGKHTIYSNHSPIRRYYITRNRRYCWDRYKEVDKEFIENDKKNDLREIIKVVLFEEEKFLKIKMVIKGILDYKKKVFGKYI